MDMQQVNQIIGALTPYAKAGWSVGTSVMRVESIGHVVAAIGGIIVCGVLAVVYRRFRMNHPGRINFEDEIFFFPLIIVGLSAFIVLAVWTIITLLNVWTWVGIFAPSLALAHEILGRLK